MSSLGKPYKAPTRAQSLKARNKRNAAMAATVRGRPAVMVPASARVVAAPKGAPAKPGKGTPTVDEKKWLDAIVQYGCIACIVEGSSPRPPCVHHILRGGRRMGHLWSLPLCPGHHQDGTGPAGVRFVARHPDKANFEREFGTELELLGDLRRALGYEGATP